MIEKPEDQKDQNKSELESQQEIQTELSYPREKVVTLEPQEKEFYLEKGQEKTRGILTYVLVGTLVVSLVVFSIFIFISDLNGESKKELITLIWTSQITLIGTALGFYFGKK